jgi:hypothetical protein
MPCTPFTVDVTIVTLDQTKKITFGLARSCNNDGSESWKINFELDEKVGSATDFQLVAKVSVTVGKDDHAAANTVAQNMQQNQSLSDAQTAQAISAGDTVKASGGNANSPAVQADLVQVLHADD